MGQVSLPDADLYAGMPKLNTRTPNSLDVFLSFEFWVKSETLII